MTQKTKKIVTNTDRKPCGCVIETHSDKTKLVHPCVPCGLNDAAMCLSQSAQAMNTAAQALSAVATTIAKKGQENASIAIADAIKNVGRG